MCGEGGGAHCLKTPRENAALPAAIQKKLCCVKVIKKQNVALVQERFHHKRNFSKVKAKKQRKKKAGNEGGEEKQMDKEGWKGRNSMLLSIIYNHFST